jgi:transposase
MTGVPWTVAGPRLSALAALLSGQYHLPRRATEELLGDVLNIELSLGAISHLEARVSAVLAAPVAEARAYAQAQRVVHADETGFKEGPKKKAWLWVLCSSLVTVFRIQPKRSQEMAKEMLGAGIPGRVVVSDRYCAYGHLSDDERQLCWSHVLRDFEWLKERGGMVGFYGEKLLLCGKELFDLWHKVKRGELSRERFAQRAARLEEDVGHWLRGGEATGTPRASGMCREILRHEKALWTFVRRAGVEPTNNAAERALRRGVLWRKISFGAWSARGSRYVERLLSVVASLRQQKRNVLEYLTAACRAALRGEDAPSLLPSVAAPA